jgi:zinc protease
MLAPESTHAVVEEAVRKAIQEVVTDGVEQSEIDRTMSALRAQEAYLRDGQYSVAAQLNEAIAAGDWTLYVDNLERLSKLSSADVQGAASRYLVREKMTVGRFVPTA